MVSSRGRWLGSHGLLILTPLVRHACGRASDVGFDDPEVMAAVSEISTDPSKMMTKYKDNKKVAAFYKAMAGMIGSQLESMENKTL